MIPHPLPGRRRAIPSRASGAVRSTAAARLAGTVVAVVILSTGCGVKGPPIPPMPREPGPASALRVRQDGEAIVLSFRPPERRADGRPLDPPVRFEVLAHVSQRPSLEALGGAVRAPVDARATPGTTAAPAPSGPPAGAEPARAAVDPAATRFPRPGRREVETMMRGALEVKVLERASAEDAGREEVRIEPGDLPGVRLESARLAFGVAVVDGRGRRAQARSVAFIEPVPSPPAPGALAARVLETGVLLSWKRPDLADYPADRGEAGLAVYRRLAGKAPSVRAVRVLRPDADGYLDEQVVFGSDYEYEVRTVLGDPSRRLESAPAGPVAVPVRDTFPPAPPDGLTAVASRDGIRLFWYPSRSADLSGYRVYRARVSVSGEGDPAAGSTPEPDGFERLTPEPVRTTTWLDAGVVTGSRYAYRVSAVDRAKPPNESARSVEVRETAGLPGGVPAAAEPGGNP